MQIVHDSIIYSLQKVGGISSYWANLAKRIEVEVELVYPGHEENIAYEKRSEARLASSRALERFRDVLCDEVEDGLFHSSYYRIAKGHAVLNITTLHDLIYEKFRKDAAGRLHILQKKRAIDKSSGVIFVSGSTENDFREYFPKAKCLTKVIYNGVSDDYFPIASSRKGEFVVFVGSRQRYKNFALAAKAVAYFRDISLAVVGGGVFNYQEKQLIADLGMQGRVEHYLGLPNTDINRLLNEAVCLLYPSSYEGFGIPVVEAMAAGCPVICSRIPALVEVAGDSAIFFDHSSPGSLVDALGEMFRHDQADLVTRGIARAKLFSWDRTAKETLAFYEEVANGSIPS